MQNSINSILLSWNVNTSCGCPDSDLHTDGNFLTSVGIVIGVTLNGKKILFKYRDNYSENSKTDMHVFLAQEYAHEVVDPCYEEFYWDALTSS
jgi:hypothetical protein